LLEDRYVLIKIRGSPEDRHYNGDGLARYTGTMKMRACPEIALVTLLESGAALT
jgi:hypothetical protein